MEINICDKDCIVEIWLASKEKTDKHLRSSLQPLFDEYKRRKYKVALFQSGSSNLAEQTTGLLLHNRTP